MVYFIRSQKMLLILLLGFFKNEELFLIIICIIVGRLLDVLLVGHLSPQVMIMIYQLLNTVAQVVGKPDLAPAAWVRKLVTLCDEAPITPSNCYPN
ncbi:hypothetical protein L1887_30022 [Cichorium endivia]|nr:hypothetical protein L1887_30022 [Cichorium endivia]